MIGTDEEVINSMCVWAQQLCYACDTTSPKMMHICCYIRVACIVGMVLPPEDVGMVLPPEDIM